MQSNAGSSNDRYTDVERFLARLRSLPDFLQEGQPVFIARAPGRLDVMGGIADYSGSLVLEMPLKAATFVAIQPTSDGTITIQSIAASSFGSAPLFTCALAELCPPGAPLEYASAHQLFKADLSKAWAAYVAGTLVVLQRERQIEFTQGMRMVIDCEVPIGKGVSSSASLEVATMQAVCALIGYSLSEREMALLCQKVENLIVGAACGIMDQFTVVSGQPDHLLALLCQPAELQVPIPLPAEITFWGIDSGIRHAVTGSDYEAVRVGAFMGYRLIAEQAGLAVRQSDSGLVEIQDARWGGYLANITPTEWERFYRDHLPLEIEGAAFLERYGGSTDTVTTIRPERRYAVRQPTAHPIYEHHRVRLFRALLTHPELPSEHLVLAGELMYQSHASYSACGLGSNGTDRLVELVAQAGVSQGLYGARITGGGSGGTVAVLAHRDAQDTILHIVKQYEEERGGNVVCLHGTSPGAASWGSLQFRL